MNPHSPMQSAPSEVSPNIIWSSATNPRKSYPPEKQRELEESVRQHGVIQPILVRDWPAHRPTVGDGLPAYEIICGERRWRAAVEVETETVPILVRNDFSDRDIIALQMIENLQREDLNEFEEADGYRLMLKEHGYTADELAEKIGKSRAYIYGRLKLTELCDTGRRMAEGGSLSASTALLVARIPGHALQEKALAEISKTDYSGDTMSHRAAMRWLRDRYTLALSQAPFDPEDATLNPDAGPCSACPKRSGNCAEAYPDIESADVCTDPDCHSVKRLANAARMKAQAELTGQRIVTGKEAEKALQYGNFTLSLVGLQAADEPAHNVKTEEGAEIPRYEELAAKLEVPIVLVEDQRTGNMIKTVDTTVMEEALQRAGLLEERKQSEKDEARLAKQKEQQRIFQEQKAGADSETEKRQQMFAEIRAAWSKNIGSNLNTQAEELRLIAFGAFNEASYVLLADPVFLAAWGLEADDKDSQELAFKERIESLTSNECMLLLLDICRANIGTVNSFDGAVNSIATPRLLTEAHTVWVQKQQETARRKAKAKKSEPALTPDKAAQAQKKGEADDLPPVTPNATIVSVNAWPFPADSAAQAEEPSAPVKPKRAAKQKSSAAGATEKPKKEAAIAANKSAAKAKKSGRAKPAGEKGKIQASGDEEPHYRCEKTVDAFAEGGAA